jgi:hypothetical protein
MKRVDFTIICHRNDNIKAENMIKDWINTYPNLTFAIRNLLPSMEKHLFGNDIEPGQYFLMGKNEKLLTRVELGLCDETNTKNI